MFKRIFLLLGMFYFLCPVIFAQTEKKLQPVDILTVKGVINPIVAGYVIKGIETSEGDEAICIVKMDTPGGLDSSMRQIIQKIISSDVPVIVYVYPEGGRAASAGVYILYASHLAAMAPSTNIGAAHPVQMGTQGEREKDEEMNKKITNDAVAHIKALAKKRGRNIEWAEKSVRESVSITADEAKQNKVIELIAKDINNLLKEIKGIKVKVKDKEWVLYPDEGRIKEINMTWIEHFLFTISDPNIAFILMMLGIYGLIYELASPGAIFPGVMGAICLILALYSLGTLPINYAGLFLIIFSFILFILDVKAPTHGVLTVGGIISLILGAMMLIPAGYPYLAISKSLIFSVALVTGLFFAYIVTMAVSGLKKKIVSGKEEMMGAKGTAREKIDSDDGMVFVKGELWKARTRGEVINTGEKVIVTDIDELTLMVKRYPGEASG